MIIMGLACTSVATVFLVTWRRLGKDMVDRTGCKPRSRHKLHKWLIEGRIAPLFLR